MAIGTYISIITFMDKMLQPKDTDWLNGYKNKTHIYMLSTRNSLQTSRHI